MKRVCPTSERHSGGPSVQTWAQNPTKLEQCSFCWLNDGYHWWRFGILRLRSGLKPSTVLFLRARNSSLWFFFRPDASREIKPLDHRTSVQSQRTTTNSNRGDWMAEELQRYLASKTRQTLIKVEGKKPNSFHLFLKSGRSSLAQTISLKTPWRMQKIMNNFYIKWSIATKQLSESSFTKSNVKI